MEIERWERIERIERNGDREIKIDKKKRDGDREMERSSSLFPRADYSVTFGDQLLL